MTLRCCLTVFIKGVSCFVLYILLSAWLASCLVFVSRKLIHLLMLGCRGGGLYVTADIKTWEVSSMLYIAGCCTDHECFFAVFSTLPLLVQSLTHVFWLKQKISPIVSCKSTNVLCTFSWQAVSSSGTLG